MALKIGKAVDKDCEVLLKMNENTIITKIGIKEKINPEAA